MVRALDEPCDHVMIDIETLSLSKHNALILSIGMVEFDPDPIEGPRFGGQMLLLPDINRQLLLGREVSTSTQKFWRDQSEDASAHWVGYHGERVDLPSTMRWVKEFCATASRVWANGTQFDLSNLETLNEQLGPLGQKELWHYQKPRDMRTYCRETPPTRLLRSDDTLNIAGVPHEPIYDCMVQAWKVWAHRSF
jgi:hypothetical protein